MKKTTSIYLAFYLLIAVLTVSCSDSEYKGDVDKQQSVLKKFNICQEIATYHSAGLEYTTKQLMGQGTRKTPINKLSTKEKIATINASVADFVVRKDVLSELNSFENKIDLKMIDNKKNVLRSGGNTSDDTQIVRLFSYFDRIVDKISTVSSTESSILSAIQSEEFLSFTEEEQNTLLIMFAIYEDSSQYWTKNASLLQFAQTDGETSLRSGSVVSATDGDIDIDDAAWRTIFKADAASAVEWGIGGAILGGLGGAVIGGVGVVPGALYGGSSGVIAGAVGGSVRAWLFPNEVGMDKDNILNNTTIEEKTITSTLTIRNNLNKLNNE